MNLYTIVKSLQAAQGNNAKLAILQDNKDNELFRAYMHATYAVDINYYQKKIAKTDVVGSRPFDAIDITSMRSQLARRMLTGKQAIEALRGNYEALNPEGQELLRLMIDRSIGASVGDSMVLKTWPDLYFIPPYMRCSSMDDKTKKYYQSLPFFYVQTKRDGSFAYLRRNVDHTADVITRQGNTFPAWFADRMAHGLTPGVVLVGEMEVYENGKLMSRKDGNGVLNSVQAGADEYDFNQYEFRYVAWDRLTQDEFKAGQSLLAYQLRLDLLKIELAFAQEAGSTSIELIQSDTVMSVADANAIHIDHTKRGLEGTVWKDPEGIWRDSSSGTKYAVKNKVVFEAEYEIVDSYEGEGKDAGSLGGITVKTKCGKLLNNCGSGFSAKQRKELWAIRQELPGQIVTLEANDITTSRTKDTVSLSLPIFIEIRTDKKEADTLERVYEQLEAAKFGRSIS